MCANEIGSELLDEVAEKNSFSSVGCRLKLIREAYGISQRELAKRAGVTNSSISMIELGQVSPSIYSLERILAVIPIRLADFFSFQPVSSIRVTRTSAESIVNEIPISQKDDQLNSRTIIVPSKSASPFGLLETDACGVVVGGNATLKSITGAQHLAPGDSFYIPARQIHQFVNCGEVSLQIFICTGFVLQN